MRAFTLYFSLVLFGLVAIAANPAQAQDETYKGALIYQFTRYIEWGTLGPQFGINIIGNSPVNGVLEAIAAKKMVGTSKMVVNQADDATSKSPKIIFVSAAQKDQLAAIMAKVKGKGILVITESPGLGQAGSPLNFIKKDGKVQFELNKSAFAACGLKIPLALERLAAETY